MSTSLFAKKTQIIVDTGQFYMIKLAHPNENDSHLEKIKIKPAKAGFCVSDF
jgi:hypothetical protein